MVLATARLTLRPPSLADFDGMAAMWADPGTVRHITGVPSTRQQSWQRLLARAGHWSLAGFGGWTVRETATGRFAGEAGFATYHRNTDPPVDAPEAGWVFAAWARGQGFATEAVRAMLGWADAAWPEGRTMCVIDPGNAASIRLAERCGYRLLTVGQYQAETALFYARNSRCGARGATVGARSSGEGP